MDLNQSKLTRSEWDSIERPVDKDEMKIIKMISSGFKDTDIKFNENESLISFIKLSDVNDAMHYHIYSIHFAEHIKKLITKYDIDYNIPERPKNSGTLKKSDSFKLENKDKNYIDNNSGHIYDFTILEAITHVLKNKTKLNKRWKYFYYTLSQMKIQSIKNVNPFVIEFQNYILDKFLPEMDVNTIIENAQEYIEKNHCLIHYSDVKLYGHQKDLFNIFNKPLQPIDKPIDTNKYTSRKNLVLYIAPTATGKTLSPLGLSQSYKVIFVCAARHVGIALSKSAISAGKKIAFGFGCGDATDIRLHYAAAHSYVKHDKTGREIKYKDGNKKVDNSDGSKVEIIICDLLSYNAAMNYMLAWNKPHEMITYWDEPTITLDYTNHECHHLIQENWSKNVIPNVILSSATLPNEEEIEDVIDDFKTRFISINRKELQGLNSEKENAKEVIEEYTNYIKEEKDTLSKEEIDEIDYKLHNYKERLENIEKQIPYFKWEAETPTNISVIKSYECKKTISILNKDGYVELPHFMFDNYKDVKTSVQHIRNNKTILRYLDLEEICNFIIWINKRVDLNDHDADFRDMIQSKYTISNVFTSIEDVNMMNIKLNYLDILENINTQSYSWNVIHTMILNERKFKIKPNSKIVDANTLVKTKSFDNSGTTLDTVYDLKRSASFDPNKKKSANPTGFVNVTTSDAFSLTDGPTIYIAEDVDKIAKFCLKTAQIPSVIMKHITDSIAFNNKINNKLSKLEKDLEDAMAPFEEKEKRITKDSLPPEIKNMRTEINKLNGMIKSVTLPEVYIPNKIEHLTKWTNSSSTNTERPYTSRISDNDVEKLMAIKDVDDIWKILLLLGIGLFSQSTSIAYTELVKEFAINQKLYLIIADGDYIYGTNYQFCHGYLSKDLIKTLTQEKAIQAMGRIGRNKFQLEYTIRFRENDIIKKIFVPDEDKPEARNMCRLFSTDYSLLH
jgi:hypothetical protein